MSRIGKQPIKILAGVKVVIKGNVVSFEGPKGKLAHTVPNGVLVKVEADHLSVTRDDSVENAAALHGLTRTILNNCMHGTHSGFSKGLEINGVGYRATVTGQTLNMTLGFSHPVVFTLPVGITAKVDANTKVTISGADRHLVGLVSAQVRGLKPVEPYQGKGIRYAGEVVKRKAGKAAGAAGSK